MLSTPRAALVPLGSGTVAARHDWPVPKHINAPYTAGPGRPSRRRELGRTARLAPRAVAWQCPHRINLDYHGPFQDGACLRSDLVRAPVDIPTSGSSGVATDGLIGGGHTHGCRQNALVGLRRIWAAVAGLIQAGQAAPWAQSQTSMPHALERIREMARERKKEKRKGGHITRIESHRAGHLQPSSIDDHLLA
jgi:hypothetical protein